MKKMRHSTHDNARSFRMHHHAPVYHTALLGVLFVFSFAFFTYVLYSNALLHKQVSLVQAASSPDPVVYYTDVTVAPPGGYICIFGRNIAGGAVYYRDTSGYVSTGSGGTVLTQGTALDQGICSNIQALLLDGPLKIYVRMPSGQLSNELDVTKVSGNLFWKAPPPFGNDGSSSSCQDSATPCETWAPIIPQLAAGDQVILFGGTHTDVWNNGNPPDAIKISQWDFDPVLGPQPSPPGTAASPITIRSWPGDLVELPSFSIGYQRGITIELPYWQITGISIYASQGITFPAGATNSRIGNVYLSNSSYSGPNVTRTGTSLYNVGQQAIGNRIVGFERAGIGSDYEGQTIAYNVLRNNASTSNASITIGNSLESSNTTNVFSNRIYRDDGLPVDGISVSVAPNPAADIRLYQNIITDHRDAIAISQGKDVFVYNNSLYNDTNGIVLNNAACVANLNNIVVRNNIFDQITSRYIENRPNCTGFSFTSDSNIFRQDGATRFEWTSVSNYPGWQTQTGADNNACGAGPCDGASVWGDPLFQNPVGGDFHLQPASPAKNLVASNTIGTTGAATVTIPSRDYEWNPRPFGANYDLGAYEDYLVDTTPPTGVGNISPANGATNVSINATLTAATASDATPPIEYNFELYTGATCSGAPVQSRAYAASTVWNTAALNYSTVYSWRNRARDSVFPTANESGFGPCWSFTTQAAPDTASPTGVGNVSPANAATNVPVNTTLTAATASDATPPIEYNFELYAGATCSGAPVQSRAYAASTTWGPSILNYSTVYSWRNRARDSVVPTANVSSFGPCWSFTTAAPICGDTVIDPPEVCDSTNLSGQTCVTQGFTGGTLSCNATCSGYDTSGCFVCGNNAASAAEVCDGTDLKGQTCISQGFAGGALSCAPTCDAFNTSACLAVTTRVPDHPPLSTSDVRPIDATGNPIAGSWERDGRNVLAIKVWATAPTAQRSFQAVYVSPSVNTVFATFPNASNWACSYSYTPGWNLIDCPDGPDADTISDCDPTVVTNTWRRPFSYEGSTDANKTYCSASYPDQVGGDSRWIWAPPDSAGSCNNVQIAYCRLEFGIDLGGGSPYGPGEYCGDGIRQSIEECDAGTNNGVCPKTCYTNCLLNTCEPGDPWEPPTCFVTGTKVLTPAGPRFIQDLQEGDEVVAYDEASGEDTVARVSLRRAYQRDHYYEINQSLRVTAEHRFAIQRGGGIQWVEVYRLKVGDTMVVHGGGFQTISSITVHQPQQSIEVFNPALTYPHTYYVQDEGGGYVLVHNAKCQTCFPYRENPFGP